MEENIIKSDIKSALKESGYSKSDKNTVFIYRKHLNCAKDLTYLELISVYSSQLEKDTKC